MMKSNNNVPRVWKDSAMSAIYTLTPTHCGIGQAAASVDLPIARDAATGFPILPATSLKGVAREYFEDLDTHVDYKLTEALFGPSLDNQEERANSSQALRAGGLAFTEGRLAAWPARSLNRPFLHVTCPLIIDKLVQDARLLGREELPKPEVPWQPNRAYVGDKELAGKALVIEDLCYAGEEVVFNGEVAAYAAALAGLLPDEEKASATRLEKGLVVLPDAEFHDLLQRAIPVAARTQLTGGKTTDKWVNPDGDTESGNLWYEEYLPSDCLFIAFIGQRRQVYMQNDADNRPGGELVTDPIGKFIDIWNRLPFIQIGGNETVGQGLCLWSVPGGERRAL